MYIEELAELIMVSIDSVNSLSVKPDKCAILQESLNQLQQIREKDGRAPVGNSSASGSSGCSTMTVKLITFIQVHIHSILLVKLLENACNRAI